MQRRDALASLAASGAGILLGGCTPSAASRAESDANSEALIEPMLSQLTGYSVRPGEAAAVLASLNGSRFTAPVDPTIQPQSDFDPDVDA